MVCILLHPGARHLVAVRALRFGLGLLPWMGPNAPVIAATKANAVLRFMSFPFVVKNL